MAEVEAWPLPSEPITIQSNKVPWWIELMLAATGNGKPKRRFGTEVKKGSLAQYDFTYTFNTYTVGD
ncbi:MAG: hypothetical protein WBP26_00440 [Candidatus Saccharimonadales bacterium]